VAEAKAQEKVAAGLTPRAMMAVLVLTVLFAFINAHGYQVTGASLFYNRWPYEWQNGVPIVSMGLVFLLVFILEILGVKAKFTSAELAAVALAGLILSSPIPTTNFSYILLTQAGMSAPGNEWAYQVRATVAMARSQGGCRYTEGWVSACTLALDRNASLHVDRNVALMGFHGLLPSLHLQEKDPRD
jgi:hypothetical protein